MTTKGKQTRCWETQSYKTKNCIYTHCTLRASKLFKRDDVIAWFFPAMDSTEKLVFLSLQMTSAVFFL